ncbi:MAG: lysostaphin resistance A-like protein [Bacteroidaceae bacterium]
MNKYLKPTWAVIAFLFAQGVAGFLLLLASTAGNIEQTPTLLALSVILSNVITVGICYKPLGLLRIPQSYDVYEVKWDRTLTAVVGTITGVFALNIYSELLALPDLMGLEINGLIHNTYGVLSITIVAPVCEEMLFRESMLGGMLRDGVKPWGAILLSALLFGILHVNPAQLLGTFGIGFLLGIVYWKTGNAVLPILLHMLNNTICAITTRWMGDAVTEFSFIHYLGGTWPAVVCALCCTAACVYLFRCFLIDYPTKDTPSAIVSDSE